LTKENKFEEAHNYKLIFKLLTLKESEFAKEFCIELQSSIEDEECSQVLNQILIYVSKNTLLFLDIFLGSRT